MIDSRVGPYRLLGKIGEGGMGTVWLAEHEVLSRRAAIKLLNPRASAQPELVARFLNEAKAATAISDPGIVQVFDVGETADGDTYIVMELLDGETLHDRLERGGLSVGDALRIVRQVASSLGAAHQRGIVHRDLKPENIFLVRDPEVAGGERAKILDFGIAKLTGLASGVQTQASVVMGTPLYMSPEQCRGAGEVDARADVYSLGCVLFSLLAGRTPFVAEGAGELIALHLTEEAPRVSAFVPDVPHPIDELVARCLEKSPEARFADGAALAAALGDVARITPLPMHVTPVLPYQAPVARDTTLSSAISVSQRPARSHRLRIAIIAASVVAAGAVAFVVLRTDRDKPAPPPAQPGSAIAVTQLPPIDAPAPAPIEPAPVVDENAQIATAMTHAFAAFETWAKTHARAACPPASALPDGPHRDPWGTALVLTCTDQPGTQQIGLVSAGPDRALGTADDIASWTLAAAVTEHVRGARWKSATEHHSVRPVTIQRPPDEIPEPRPPVPVKPAFVDKDGDGIPDKR